MHLGRLQGLFQRQRREDPGQAACDHRLAGARRTHEQEVMRTSGRDFERTLRRCLATNVQEIEPARIGPRQQRLDVDPRGGQFGPAV